MTSVAKRNEAEAGVNHLSRAASPVGEICGQWRIRYFYHTSKTLIMLIRNDALQRHLAVLALSICFCLLCLSGNMQHYTEGDHNAIIGLLKNLLSLNAPADACSLMAKVVSVCYAASETSDICNGQRWIYPLQPC
jgi:hypothetical protein